ncbi:hypothetical protein [uncultured Chryseobacterium sp.]|uniref:hypothetical protein n=1 Tax=uncultured Chryseobacterium sp. TaxID=259322 RepID=UPI0025EE5C58|nr:hypothetical protein [uncultured Chryseobacterium sp.]
MNDGLLAIFAGLLGSILTVITTKILEIFQKKSEFKIELKKQFFIKKLQAGETAIIQYTHLSVALQQLNVLYADHDKLQTGINQILKENFLEQINRKLEFINSTSLTLSSSIGLYFDFKEHSLETKIFNTISEKVFVLSSFIHSADVAYENFTRTVGTEEEDQCYEKYETEYNKVICAMKDIAILYNQCDEEIRSQMKQMRNEMRKYE